MQLNSTQIAALDKDNRQFNLLTGTLFSDFVQDMLDGLEAGTVGSTANGYDLNAVAPADTWCAQNADTTTGLTLGYRAGKVRFGNTLVSVSAGTIALSSSTTNYVEVDSAGTVSKNTSAFTATRIPLFTVVTGGSTITTVTPAVYARFGLSTGSITGTLASTAMQTKSLVIPLGTIATSAGSTKFCIPVPSVGSAAQISRVSFVNAADLATSDTNYATFGLVNKGAAGTGTQAIVNIATAANSTKVTGGALLADYVARDLTLATLSIGTERDVATGDTLEFTITVAGTLGNTLPQSSLLVEFKIVE
ncbi:hypothetical protein [Humisphaera borealis]|uniref:Uncharacterized protein n=1 Tax=Humisphaera borealis TaxID=2807512 RepID=A0A7M2WZR5_9BACT|nr:hypothetical protein [Humisphaera borealis]QOV90893.1 hypothetical protein IPV69_05905 [Humisphaera borealis]